MIRLAFMLLEKLELVIKLGGINIFHANQVTSAQYHPIHPVLSHKQISTAHT